MAIGAVITGIDTNFRHRAFHDEGNSGDYNPKGAQNILLRPIDSRFDNLLQSVDLCK